MLITKFEIIIAVLTAAALQYEGYNPLLGILTIVMIKLLDLSMTTQKKRNKIFSSMRLSKEYFLMKDFRGVLGFFLFFESLAGITLYYQNVSLATLLIPILVCYPADLIRYISWNIYKTNKMIPKMERNFQDDIKIIENIGGILTVNSKIPLNDTNKTNLAIICNSTILNITQDIKKKHIFYIKHQQGKEDRYNKLEKGSKERLEQILLDLRGKPVFINSLTDKFQDTYIYQSKLKLKFVNREIQDITHKLGLKKGSLEVITNDGSYEFKIKKGLNITYYLDNVIENTKKPSKMVLPMIIGCENATGKVIVKDLTKLTHILLGGMTNTGKSCTLNTWLDSLLFWNYDKVILFVTDYKHSALMKYKKIRNCCLVDDSEKSQMEFYNNLYIELIRRRDLFESVTENLEIECRDIHDYNRLYPDSPLPYIVVATDEINTACQMNYTNMYSIGGMELNYEDIRVYFFTKSRSLGIHLIDTVQKATAGQYVKSWRASIDSRGCHKMAEESEIKYVLEQSKEFYEFGMTQDQGEFLFKDNLSQIYKLKGCFIDENNSKVFESIKIIGSSPARRKTIEIESAIPDQTAI